MCVFLTQSKSCVNHFYDMKATYSSFGTDSTVITGSNALVILVARTISVGKSMWNVACYFQQNVMFQDDNDGGRSLGLGQCSLN